MSAAPKIADIPAMINQFLNRDLPNGRNMAAWLFIDLPEILEITKKHHYDCCNENLEELGYRLGSSTIQQLTMDAPDFPVHHARLRHEYEVPDGSEERKLVSRITGHAEQYHSAVRQLAFFQDKLWPTLMALRNGDAPDVKHLTHLDMAAGAHPIGSNLELYTQESWIPGHLQIPVDSSDDIMKFLSTLRNIVRDRRMHGRVEQGGRGDL